MPEDAYSGNWILVREMSDCSSEGFRKEFGPAPRIPALRVPRGWRAALIAEATPPRARAGMRDLALVQDAAFHAYARGASDYRP